MIRDIILEKKDELIMQIWTLLRKHRITDLQKIARAHCVIDAELEGEQIAIEVVELLGRILNVNLKPEPKKKPELGVMKWNE